MTDDRERLSLYHYEGCGYCTMVRREIDRLGLDVELRDVFDPEHRATLREARGRTSVPVLRIQGPHGLDHFMPESRDIVHWLRDRYGAFDAVPADGAD